VDISTSWRDKCIFAIYIEYRHQQLPFIGVLKFSNGDRGEITDTVSGIDVK